MHIRVFTDGTSRPKLISKKKRSITGPSAAAVVIKHGDEILFKKAEYVGELDNNQAEFEAFIMALNIVKNMKFEKVTFFTDSNLIQKLMTGKYTGKAESILGYIQEAKELLSTIDNWEVIWIPRGGNREADKLARQVIDRMIESQKI